MAKLSAPKKPTAKAAPKKPTSRSKTGNAACSEAASNWQLSIRGKAALSPETYKTLAKCRSLNRAGKLAEAQGRTGKLSEMGEAAVKGRLQSRFDSGLITQKARTEKLNLLLKQRSEREKLAAPKLAPGRGTPERSAIAKTLVQNREMTRGIYGPKIEYAELVRRQESAVKAPVQPESPWLAGKTASVPAKSAPSPARNEAAKVLSDLRKKGLRYEAKEVRRIAREQVATESRDAYNTAVARGERGHDRLKSLTLGTAEKSAAVPQRIVQVARDTGLSQPARYSLGGKLAPGRGTEERKKVAGVVRSLRTGDAQAAAGTLKAAGVVAIPSKFDAKKVAIKERDLWNAYTPREAAYRVLATRTLAGAQRKRKHMLRLGWVTP